MIQNNPTTSVIPGSKTWCRSARKESFAPRILRLPTVQENDQSSFDQTRDVRSSFYFNPVPVSNDPLYTGEILLFMSGKAEIAVCPAFGFMRALGESREDLFDFSGSPLAFVHEYEGRKPHVIKRQFASHKDMYWCVREYYVWFISKLQQEMTLDELGYITRDQNGLKQEFISFWLRQPLH